MKLQLLFLLLFAAFTASARQSYTIKGVVTDTASKVELQNTSVSVLNAKDSTLVKFTRAGVDGSFSINNLVKGKFILLVTYPDYADYIEPFSLDSVNRAHDFSKIVLTLKSRLLQEVMLKGEVAAIKIKGDTTEFNAKAFVIQPNSKVEDLLRQLPGIQVDKDGKITAQGQTVTKVLVDGEEFFGDDPTLVTKNIRGDMVDKVQLYDKKSDQATFTGIDDGEKTKTINIKLKEESKKGYFGKVDGGSSPQSSYQGEAMVNSFTAKSKVSGYGILANTGKVGLSWRDNDKYSGSNNVEVIDGGIYISNGDDFSDNDYYGEGIPVSRSAGVHYDRKWGKDKYSINTNYKANSLEVDGSNNTLTQNNLPTGIQLTNADGKSTSTSFRQKLDATLQVKFDSTTTLKLSASGTLKKTNNLSENLSSGTRGDATQLNKSSRVTDNDGHQQQYNFSALLTKQLKKKGRTFSLSLSDAIVNSNTDGFLNSSNTYYNNAGVFDSLQAIDQHKLTDLGSNVLNSNLTYTEPFSKALSVILNYGFAMNKNTADRQSYNLSAPGVYGNLDKQYSNNFDLSQVSNQGGAVMNFTKKKSTINFGAKGTSVQFKEKDVLTGKEYNRNFVNWAPQASLSYRFSNQRSLRVSYRGNSNQPAIEDIQPVRVNDDPLNIVLGNADLRPSFNNNLNLSYYSYKVISNQSVNLYGYYSFTDNAIVSNTSTDNSGKSVRQSINLKGKSPLNFYGEISGDRKIKGLEFNVGLRLGMDGSIYYNYSNNALNETQSYTYSPGVNLSKYVAKKFDINANFGPTYTVNESSLQKETNNNGKGARGYGSFNIYLPGKLQLGSNVNYTFKGKTTSFNENYQSFIVTSTLSKKFFKAESLELSLAANDLFNQNNGFDRSAYSNVISQNRYNTVKRYFLFSLSYDFSKMGGVPAKK